MEPSRPHTHFSDGDRSMDDVLLSAAEEPMLRASDPFVILTLIATGRINQQLPSSGSGARVATRQRQRRCRPPASTASTAGASAAAWAGVAPAVRPPSRQSITALPFRPICYNCEIPTALNKSSAGHDPFSPVSNLVATFLN